MTGWRQNNWQENDKNAFKNDKLILVKDENGDKYL